MDIPSGDHIADTQMRIEEIPITPQPNRFVPCSPILTGFLELAAPANKLAKHSPKYISFAVIAECFGDGWLLGHTNETQFAHSIIIVPAF
jgi:hypothetical protein